MAERLTQPPALADRVVIVAAGSARPQAGDLPAGAQARGVRLILLPPGTRGVPHVHAEHETVVYVVSGQAELWYGEGLRQRATVRAGDLVSLPPGAPHFAVNRGDVAAIAVAARDDRADSAPPAGTDLPPHLSGLLGLPVAEMARP
jgi:uncharacterized RmlC-like cupin family protein